MFALQLIWLFLPIGLANIFASLSRHIMPRWQSPLDFGKEFGGKRIFGSHKTIRGFVFGLTAAFLFFIFQIYLYNTCPAINQLSLIDYREPSIFIGLIMGCGALLGDAVKSFFKRQLNIPPGHPWFPFDQLDWVLGGVLLNWPFLHVSSITVITAIGLGFLFHLIFKLIGFALRVDKTLI